MSHNCAPEDIVAVDCDIYTGFGRGIQPAWEGIKNGRHAFKPIRRTGMETLQNCFAATADELDECSTPSDFLLDFAAPTAKKYAGEKTELFIGSTVGEIEQLNNAEKRCTSDSLLEKAMDRFGIRNGRILSAACASSNMALCRAASMLKARKMDFAVIYAVDFVNEFVTSGFLTLKAMTLDCCSRPYDKNRSGLLLGDGAGIAVLARAETAEKHSLKILAKIASWGMSCDAGHITAPLTDGAQLALAGRRMLEKAHVTPEEIGAVLGHGTGTLYNDIMEIRALKKLFTQQDVPLFSTKGSTGHTLAAAGLMQLAMALKVLENRLIPPQTSLETPEEGAQNMVSRELRTLNHPYLISMNAGFGGLNAALLLEGVSER